MQVSNPTNCEALIQYKDALQCSNSHCGVKTILRQSYLHNNIFILKQGPEYLTGALDKRSNRLCIDVSWSN